MDRSPLPLLVLLAACAGTPAPRIDAGADSGLAPRIEALCAELEALRVELEVPGLAIAVVEDGEVVLARGFGLADLEAGTPADEETLFACGSVTKGLTSALAAMLAEDGLVAWDDPVTRHLPYFALRLDTEDPAAELLLRDLCSHRSGFTRMTLAWAGGEVAREEALRTAARAEAWRPFRETFLYNNLAFVAAGEACAAAAGRSYESLVRERILAPLGMDASTLSLDAAERDPRLAEGYVRDPETGEHRRLPIRRLDHVAPAGALFSNATDMARWVELLLGRGVIDGRRLIAPERLEELWRPHVTLEPGVAYGLGWFLREWEGRRVVEHAGNVDGFSAEVALLPDEGVGYALLCNATATPLQARSLDLVFRHLVGGPARTPAIASVEEARGLVGRYRAGFGQLDGLTLTVLVQDDGRLALDVPGQRVYALEPPDAEGRRAFELTDSVAVSFRAFEEGRANVLVLHQHGLDLESPREGWEYPVEVPLAELEPLLGRYAVPGEDQAFEVLVKNHHLAVEVPGQSAIELHPPDEEGVRVARMTPRIRVVLHVEHGRATRMTFLDGETLLECPRVEAPPPLPTPAEIHALRRTEERAARLRAWGPTRVRSRLFSAQSGVAGVHVEQIDGPLRAATLIDLGRFGRIESAMHAAGAWEDSSFGPPRALRGDRLRQVRHGHPWIVWGDWRAAFGEERVVRRSRVDGRAAVEIHLQDGDLPAAVVDLDLETGDVLRWREPTIDPDAGTLPVTIQLSDYREVQGVRLPFRTVVSNDAVGRMVLTVEAVEIGVELGDDAFARPRPAGGS